MPRHQTPAGTDQPFAPASSSNRSPGKGSPAVVPAGCSDTHVPGCRNVAHRLRRTSADCTEHADVLAGEHRTGSVQIRLAGPATSLPSVAPAGMCQARSPVAAPRGRREERSITVPSYSFGHAPPTGAISVMSPTRVALGWSVVTCVERKPVGGRRSSVDSQGHSLGLVHRAAGAESPPLGFTFRFLKCSLQGRACSNADAAAITVASSPMRPTICNPTGSPPDDSPAGTETAGCPVKLKT